MDVTFLREAVTVLSFAAFVAIVAYAVHPGNRARFDEAARRVLDDEPSPQPSPKGEGEHVGRVFEKGSSST